MASKIQSHNFYVAITPYKVQGVEDQYNELSVFTSYNEHVHQFYVSLQAGYTTTSGGHGSFIMGDSNPLTASTCVYVKESPKNSQKTINEIGAALELAKDIIAALFDDREWNKLRVVVQNVARFGYVEQYKQQAEAYLKGRKGESVNDNDNQNEKVMEKNVKAADLIGKVIIMGTTGAKYVVNSVEGDKLICDFENPTQGMSSKNMPVPFANVQKFINDGKWTVADANDAATTEVTTDADVAEVDDIVPVVKPKAKPVEEEPDPDAVGELVYEEPKAKVEPIKPTAKPKQEKPKAKSVVGSTYRVELLPTNDGQKWPKLYGFKDESEAKKTAGKMAKTVTYSWDRDEQGEKRYYLKGGKKYCEVFQQLADALNIGEKAVIDKVCKDTVAIYQGAVAKPKKQDKPKAEKPSKGEKTYTQTELAEWLRKLNAGTDKEKAAAAKFFNDLAKAA